MTLLLSLHYIVVVVHLIASLHYIVVVQHDYLSFDGHNHGFLTVVFGNQF